MSGTKRRHTCLGCRSSIPKDGEGKFLQRKKCAFLKEHCDLLANEEVEFCYECPDYPCERLQTLDGRYREKYNMSMIENLNFIKTHGIQKFLENQKEKYSCPECGATTCVHTNRCYTCSPLS
ncbi:MAG: DUF3795 domain-containing protein [Candidatus Thorarchaeota archaeon]